MIKVEDAKDVVMDEPEEEAVTIHTTEEKEVILFKRIVGRGRGNYKNSTEDKGKTNLKSNAIIEINLDITPWNVDMVLITTKRRKQERGVHFIAGI